MNPFRAFIGSIDALEHRALPVRMTATLVGVVVVALVAWRTFFWWARLPPVPEPSCHDAFEFRSPSNGLFTCGHSKHKLVVERLDTGVADVRCLCPKDDRSGD
jgi:hypothetical protein